MSAEDRDDKKDPLQSLIAVILEAENRGDEIDRETLIEGHPDHADSLRDFFANHDRMKSAAELDPPTLPPVSGESPLNDPTIPPGTGRREDATLPPTEPALRSGEDAPVIGDKVRYFGDYELLEEIARGGMGVVYKARQANLNRIVALKMILSGQFAGEEDVQRFYTEAEAAAILDHPGIVPIFEIGEHAGQHYFSMGYIEGESLAQKVANGPLPPREAAELARKICDAMAYAHECGVIHRDLKPANILIDTNGQPKVTDFGLAKKTEADSNLTGTGQILGTPAYMPPEQASGKSAEIGPLADVYSLGAILYCLLTGRPPFQAANPMDTLLQVIDKDPVPPRLLNPSISLNLETIVLKCLAKNPAHRYESTLHLSSDLTAYLEDRAISARRPGVPEKILRLCRKHRRSIAVAVSSAAIVSIVVFSIYHLAQSYQASQFGLLSLRSRTTLRAEIIDKTTRETLVDVPVPTTSPIELKAGKYSLRVSSPGLLSDTWPIEIDPGSRQTRELSQTENVLWTTQLPGSARSNYSTVNLGARGRNILLSEIYSTAESSTSNLQMISGSTGEPIWSFKPTDEVLDSDEIRRGHYKLALPSRDLNGDHIYDLLIASRTQPVLTAINGKTGKLLWSFDATSLAKHEDPTLSADGSVLGSPSYCDFDSDGKLDVITCILFQPKGTRSRSRVEASDWFRLKDSAVRICVISGLTGKLFWNTLLPSQFTQSRRLKLHHSDAACVPVAKQAGDQCMTHLVLGGYLHSFTATESSEPIAIGFDPLCPPDFDLHAESRSGDALLFGVDVSNDIQSAPSTDNFSMKLISLQTGATKWKASLRYPDLTKEKLERGEVFDDRFRRHETYHWITDLDSDGEREIAVAQIMEDSDSGGFRSCIELHRRDSWQLIWRKSRNGLDPESQELNVRLIAGPDVNEDGHKELFVAEIVGTGDSIASLMVGCLSGKDGSVLWDRHYPLASGEHIQVAPLQWQQTGGQSPYLVVSTGAARGPMDTHFLSSHSGLVENVLPGVYAPTATDVTGDGIDDLLFDHLGSLRLIRGSPPATWKRLGKWIPYSDLNRDGTTDFVGTEYDKLIARSGVGGAKIWETSEGDFDDDAVMLTGSADNTDINDDGVSDIIALERIDANPRYPSRKNLHTVSAISGLDGKRLWTAGQIEAAIPDEDRRGGMWPVIQWTDLDLDRQRELIIAYNDYESGLVVLLNSQTGKAVWEMRNPGVFTASKLKGPHLLRDPKDINGDNVADPVLWLRSDKRKVNIGRLLTAINGANGAILWTALESTHGSPNNRKPVFADLDQDGQADVLAEHERGYLAALKGKDGSLLWEWKSDTFYFGPKLARLTNDDVAICLATPSGIVALGRDGQVKWRFATTITGVMYERWRICDLNSDGNDELVVPRGNGFVALNASDGSSIWECELPRTLSRYVKLTSLGNSNSDALTNTVVWSWNSVYAIDAAGHPLWRSEVPIHFDTRSRHQLALSFSWSNDTSLPGVTVAPPSGADIGQTSTLVRQSIPTNTKWEWIGAGRTDSVDASSAKGHDVGIESTQAPIKRSTTDLASGSNVVGFSDWLTVDRFREHFQLMKSRKMRPLELEGRSREGINEYRVKFVPNSSGLSWWARRGTSDQSYENFQKQYLAQGFTEIWHQAFIDHDGKTIHSAIWERSLSETQASDSKTGPKSVDRETASVEKDTKESQR